MNCVKYTGPRLETFRIPIEHLPIMRQRCAPIFAAWATNINGLGVENLMLSCYQQGVLDCMTMAERGRLPFQNDTTDFQI